MGPSDSRFGILLHQETPMHATLSPGPASPRRHKPLPTDSELAEINAWRDHPIPRSLAPLAVLLCELEYSGEAMDRVLEHAHRYGSIACLAWVDPGHHEMLEATLPMAPNEQWAAFDSIEWCPNNLGD
jgi:hypothetical protein